jgi:hypothetical protein
MTSTILPYTAKYAIEAHALWTVSLPTWPLDLYSFNRIAHHGLVALDHERMVGLALTDLPPSIAKSISLTIDPPSRQIDW